MPNVIGKILLFFGSYSPLFLIFGVVYWFEEKTVSYGRIFLVLFVIGFLGTLIFLSYVKRLNSLPLKIIKVKRKDTEILNYVVAYLIPFVAIIQPEPDRKMIIAFVSFFVFLGWLYIKSNVLWVNPLLSLMGYHMYEITAENDSDFTLITKKSNIKASNLTVTKIGNEILFEKVNST